MNINCVIFSTTLRKIRKDTLLNTLKNNNNNLLDLTKPILTTALIFGSNSFDKNANAYILNETMNLVDLLKDLTNRFFTEVNDRCRNNFLIRN